MMKKILFMMLFCVTQLVAWGQTQASHSVYKFTTKAAAGGLYTDAQGTAASVTAGAVCNQNYYVKSEYKKTTDPSTESITAFGVKTYYVMGGADSYTCAYGTAYKAANTYATVTEHELTGDDLNEKLSSVYRFTKDSESWVFGCNKEWNQVNEYYGDWVYSSDGIHVNEGDICDPEKDYYTNSGHTTGQGLIGWGAAVPSKSFSDTEGIFVKVNDMFVPLSTTDFDADEHYYTLVFSELNETAEATMAADVTNFETTTSLTGLSTPNSGIYYFDGVNYTEAKNGDVYHAGCYYVKEDSYAEKTPAELAVLGYTTGTTTTYNCTVVESGDKKTITITRNENWSYETMEAYLVVATDELSNHENVVIEDATNTIGSNTTLNGLIPIFNQLSNVTNIVLSDCLANNAVAYDLSSLNNSDIKRIILPNANRTSFNNITISETCPVLLEVVNKDNGICYVHSSKEGYLDAIKNSHYYSDDINNSKWIEIDGPVNAQDILFMNGIKNDRLNLAGLICSANEEEEDLRAAMHDFDNDNVKYLAWPVFSTDPSNPTYNDIFTSCSNLKAVGQFVGTAGVDGGKLFAYTKEEGAIKYITEMLGEVTKVGGTGNANVAIKHAKISGTLAAVDLFGSGNSAKIDADGHAYFYPAVDEYAFSQSRTMGAMKDSEGNVVAEHTTISGGALNNVSLVSLDLKDATFTHIEDMTLSALNILGASTTTVIIPTDPSVTELPADFVNVDGNKINEIMIPSNIQRIHARAFAASDLRHVWTNNTTTEEKCDNGATYELAEDNLVSYTDAEYKGLGEKPAKTKLVYGTYTFSENLKFIGTNVFGGSTRIHDVYMLGTQAPVCCVNAFSTESYVANNSYQSAAVVDKIDRDKYANAKYVWMTVLHFPAKCTTNQAKLYTDVTRQYSIASDERDGRGKIIYYPTMCEWNRSFTQGTTGYLWNAYGAERNGLSGTAMGFYNNAAAKAANTAMVDSYETSRSLEDYQNTANGFYVASDNTQKTSSVFYNTASNNYTALSYDDALYNADYRGWHQFVLADYGYSDDYVYDFNDFSDNNWWTICEPFSLTAQEMKAAFGPGVDLRKLISVTRDIEGKKITLNFDQNHLTGAADNDEVLVAGVPYMIKPNIDDRSNPDHMVLHFEKNHDNDARFAPKSAAALIKLLEDGKYTVPAYVINNTGDYREPVADVKVNDKYVHKHLEYTMVGTFFQYHFPLYCYFLGWNAKLNGGEGGVQFFWNNKLDKVNRSWNPYTAIIVPHIKDVITFYKPNGEFETIHYIYDAQERFGDTDDYCDINSAETYTQSAGTEAKRNLVSTVLEFNYEDGNNATGIDNVVKTNPYLNNKVYNMNGQLINNGNNNQRIAKGVYISNGKKFIVK